MEYKKLKENEITKYRGFKLKKVEKSSNCSFGGYRKLLKYIFPTVSEEKSKKYDKNQFKDELSTFLNKKSYDFSLLNLVEFLKYVQSVQNYESNKGLEPCKKRLDLLKGPVFEFLYDYNSPFFEDESFKEVCFAPFLDSFKLVVDIVLKESESEEELSKNYGFRRMVTKILGISMNNFCYLESLKEYFTEFNKEHKELFCYIKQQYCERIKDGFNAYGEKLEKISSFFTPEEQKIFTEVFKLVKEISEKFLKFKKDYAEKTEKITQNESEKQTNPTVNILHNESKEDKSGKFIPISLSSSQSLILATTTSKEERPVSTKKQTKVSQQGINQSSLLNIL